MNEIYSQFYCRDVVNVNEQAIRPQEAKTENKQLESMSHGKYFKSSVISN